MSILGASPTVYAAAIGADSPAGIADKWALAQSCPVEPREVDAADAPVKEVKVLGDDVVSSSGVGAASDPTAPAGKFLGDLPLQILVSYLKEHAYVVLTGELDGATAPFARPEG